MSRMVVLVAALGAVAALTSTASASSRAQYGVQDDAWLEVGTTKMWSLDERLAMLDRLGVDVVRYTLRWDHVAPLRPQSPANPDDPAYDWSSADALLAAPARGSTSTRITRTRAGSAAAAPRRRYKHSLARAG